MRSGVCRHATSPSSRTIEPTHVGDVGLDRESRVRAGPMHCDHLVPSVLPAEEAHLGQQASSVLSELLGADATI